MQNKEIQNLIKKLEWYAKFFKETSISNSLTEEERFVRMTMSESYLQVIDIIKHDFATDTGKKSA